MRNSWYQLWNHSKSLRVQEGQAQLPRLGNGHGLVHHFVFRHPLANNNLSQGSAIFYRLRVRRRATTGDIVEWLAGGVCRSRNGRRCREMYWDDIKKLEWPTGRAGLRIYTASSGLPEKALAKRIMMDHTSQYFFGRLMKIYSFVATDGV